MAVNDVYKYHVVTDEAFEYSHFKIDASKLKQVIVGLSKTGRDQDLKWEIVLGGWNNKISVIRRDGSPYINGDEEHTEVLRIEHSATDYQKIKGDINVFVYDGLLIVKGGNKIWMQFEDNSIKKKELRFFLINGGFAGHGSYKVKGFAAENLKGEFIFSSF